MNDHYDWDNDGASGTILIDTTTKDCIGKFIIRDKYDFVVIIIDYKQARNIYDIIGNALEVNKNNSSSSS